MNFNPPRVDRSGEPLRNQNLTGRKSTAKSAVTEALGKEAGRLLRLQLATKGVTMSDISERMGLAAKTTLPNHIRKGTVTLAELLLIHQNWRIDVNAILDVMYDDRQRRVLDNAMSHPDVVPSQVPVTPQESHEAEARVGLTASDIDLAAELGIADWGEGE